MRHPFSVDRPLAHGLTVYQGADWPIGPLMLACLLVTVFALVWRPRIGRRRIGLDAAFLAVLGLGVTVAAFATAPFSYRYAMPLYATLPAAAALAITRLRSVAGHREEPAA
jgi:riboflavin transporter FmnP